MAFYFERPRNFVFRPGQSLDLSLFGPAEESPQRLTHTFSIANDPSDEEIERPRFWRFWRVLPPRGKIGIFFGSWYTYPIARSAGVRSGAFFAGSN